MYQSITFMLELFLSHYCPSSFSSLLSPIVFLTRCSHSFPFLLQFLLTLVSPFSLFFSFLLPSSHYFSASEQADTAYGTFCLFNMIIYFVYAIILTVHRRSVIAQVINPNIEMYNSNSAEIVNPDMGHRGGDYGGDDVEL